ncbi:hypothetical protein SDC9_163272 [bioreactor metagenome]|uniref:Uncharacterized protein n=1 Tax=bioreactor metagenome TaxID=1076179 RepID=A0A645FQF8_9ZZZZ
MVGDAAGELTRRLAGIAEAGQKYAQFLRAFRQAAGAFAPLRIVGEQLGIHRLDLFGAGTRGHDNDIVTFELGNRLACQFHRQRPVAGTPGGLATAGLCRRHDDIVAGRFEQAQGGKAHRRTHQVHQAGNV